MRTSFTDFFPSPPATERPDWEEKRQRIFYVVEKAASEAEIALESVAVYGEAAEEILSFADQKEIDVLVIGASGAGRVKRAFMGSVSTKIALHAHLFGLHRNKPQSDGVVEAGNKSHMASCVGARAHAESQQFEYPCAEFPQFFEGAGRLDLLQKGKESTVAALPLRQDTLAVSRNPSTASDRPVHSTPTSREFSAH